MRCSSFERSIALLVENDLPVRDRKPVELHLAACPDCRALLEDLRESQSLFKALRHQVPAGTALSSVRERVLNEVEAVAPFWMAWIDRLVFGGLRRKTALAGVALLVVGLGALWFSARAPEPGVAELPIVTTLPPPPADAAGAPPPPQPTRVNIRRRQVPLQRAPLPSSLDLPLAPLPPQTDKPQLAIKLVTDDPQVIIYWLIDDQGD